MACKEYDVMNIHVANYNGVLPELHVHSSTFQSHSTLSGIRDLFILLFKYFCLMHYQLIHKFTEH